MRRDAKGEIYVAGIHVSGDKGDGKLSDWILSQGQIIVRGAEIEWRDEARKAPPLTLSALNLRLENDGDEHLVGLSARPPRELGPGMEVRASLEGGSVSDPAQWNGRVYAEFGYTDLAGWRAWVDYPLDVRRGEGALRLWATLTGGKITQGTADVALSNVSARLAKDLPVLEVSSVHGRVYGRETPRGYDFGVRSLALSSPGAPPMSATSFRASWEPASGTTLTQRGSVSANLIELAPLAHLAEYLPFPADLRKLLAELAPQGNLLDAKFDWTGELPDQAVFTAKTRFAGLTMNAWRSIPGFAGLSGSVEATEKKGVVNLASRKSELDLPKVFPEPRIALDSLNGEARWERTGAGRRRVAVKSVRLANLSFANEDLAGTAYGTYAWTGEGPGVVDLTAQLSRADGKSTAKYLPLSTLMGARARDWVAAAVLAGQSSDARLRLKGDLRDFPFIDPAKGQFQVAAKVSGAVLDYASGWPRIDDIDGDLLFERDRIDVVGRSGSILGVKLANVRVTPAEHARSRPAAAYRRQRRRTHGAVPGLHQAKPGAAHDRRLHRRHDFAGPRQAAPAPRTGAARDGEEQGRRRLPVRGQRRHRGRAPAADRARGRARQLHRILARDPGRARPAVRRPGADLGRLEARLRRRGDRGGQGNGRGHAPGVRSSLAPPAGRRRALYRHRRGEGRAHATHASNRRSRAYPVPCRRRCRRPPRNPCRCGSKCFRATGATGSRSRSGRRRDASWRRSSCAPAAGPAGPGGTLITGGERSRCMFSARWSPFIRWRARRRAFRNGAA